MPDTMPPLEIREIDGEPRFRFSRSPVMDISGVDAETADRDRRPTGSEDFCLQAVSEGCRGGGGGDGSCVTSMAPWESTEDACKVFDTWSLSSGQHKTSQMVARHRQEMMELVAGMPESSYELSLRDMVMELRQAEGGVAVVGGGEAKGAQIGRKRWTKKDDSSRVAVAAATRSEYLHTGFLLRMFVPGNLWMRKRGMASGAGTQKKLPPSSPPMPALVSAAERAEKDPDREWWRKTAGGESSGSGSNNSSSSNSSSSDGSINSSGGDGGSANHIIPRSLGGGCLLFMRQKKNRRAWEI